MASRGLSSLITQSLLGLSLVSCSGPTGPLSFNPSQSTSSFSSEQSSFPYSPNIPQFPFPSNQPTFHASTNPEPNYEAYVTDDPMADFDPNEFADDIDLIAIGPDPEGSEALTNHLLSLDLGYNVLNSKLLRQNLGLSIPNSQGII